MLGLNLQQLEYLVAVDNYKQFTIAAEKCFVTQPTLSMQIKKAEEQLDIVIFDRTRQPILTTPVGKKIVAQARVVINEYNRLEEIVREESGRIEGNLTIGIIPSLAPYLLPLFVGHFKNNNPLVHISFKEMITEALVKALKQDLLDAAILVTPLEENDIIEQPLFYEDVLIYAHPDHSLHKVEALTVDMLTSSGLWLLDEGHCFRSQVLNLCELQENVSSDLPLHFESGSLDTIRKMVDTEGGYTLLPGLAAEELAFDLHKQVKEFESPVPLREVSLVYSRAFYKRLLLDRLSESVQANVPEEMLHKDRGHVVEWK
ncbi:hydrogen peroxide-inducible genes activator [Carboxylicivirga sediminis]|uniref:Hydrogen peroxide-inducible genes activator n=1 Tax=Carboxylicivirga sediminis TaxID=2006564 RepID=A0A941F0D3_9BACT|nr:hydrogen peroxide-inducible genes activator [Carboxylicivirga sediminis]MBR8534202.1 hydrogen peroxide-inducible genes activator [Carboxylicivirga sediminis]